MPFPIRISLVVTYIFCFNCFCSSHNNITLHKYNRNFQKKTLIMLTFLSIYYCRLYVSSPNDSFNSIHTYTMWYNNSNEQKQQQESKIPKMKTEESTTNTNNNIWFTNIYIFFNNWRFAFIGFVCMVLTYCQIRIPQHQIS